MCPEERETLCLLKVVMNMDLPAIRASPVDNNNGPEHSEALYCCYKLILGNVFQHKNSFYLFKKGT